MDEKTLVMESEAPKWGTFSLAWHSCQIKSCKLVCGESLCEIKLHVFIRNLEFFSPILYYWILPWWNER